MGLPEFIIRNLFYLRSLFYLQLFKIYNSLPQTILEVLIVLGLVKKGGFVKHFYSSHKNIIYLWRELYEDSFAQTLNTNCFYLNSNIKYYNAANYLHIICLVPIH